MNKVVRGQRYRLNARDLNSLADTKQLAQRTLQRGINIGAPDTKSGIVMVRNQSGADQPMFAVMKIDSITVPYSANQNEFLYRFGFEVKTPDADNQDNICVLQEPIADGDMGEAMVVGITPALIDNTSPSTAGDCGVVSGQVYLTAGKTGALSMPGIATGTAPTWGIVRLGKSKAGSGNATARIATTSTSTTHSGLAAIDGVTPADGDIILDKDNATSALRGLWVAHSGAWTRTGDLTSGMLVSVREGATGKDTLWILDTSGAIIIGTTGINFSQIGAPNIVTVKAKSSSGLTHSGLQTIDGIACASGDLVFDAPNVYRVLTGTWDLVYSNPKSVNVAAGTANGLLVWMYDGVAYHANAGVYT